VVHADCTRGEHCGGQEPKPGWNGVVDCEVLEASEPSLLRYSWIGADGGGDLTEVIYRLEPHAGGTRFTYEHTGGRTPRLAAGAGRAGQLHEQRSWTRH
jgi:uncharacterized protein YndB with AHSA1/START domain